MYFTNRYDVKMKQKQKKIGWQKYEDLIEKQMSSPLLKTVIEQMMITHSEEYEEEEQEEEVYNSNTTSSGIPLLPISKELMDDMAMLANFDCWVGHTNFDITKETRNILNQTEGVELLKVLSRYRFFIGIGKMFDFKEVRKSIENSLMK
jgi:hypothetical protein